MVSASANKLSRLKEQAEEYAALIMEELDPERLGYIEVCKFWHNIYKKFSIIKLKICGYIFYILYEHIRTCLLSKDQVNDVL